MKLHLPNFEEPREGFEDQNSIPVKIMMRFLLPAIVILIFVSSCISNKKIIYLQNDQVTTADSALYNQYKRFEYKIQVNDVLYVSVRSRDQKTTEIFNNTNTPFAQPTVGYNGSGMYLSGYSVTDSGYIEMPIIGNVKVLGLTLNGAKLLIQNNINQFFINSYVVVKLAGINFSVLGEVRNPSRTVLYQNQVTLFEAIATAGDLTTIANRKKVSLLRQYPEGTKVHYLNLLDKNIITSPYYFIQPNDVIYIEPLKVKEAGTGVTGAQTFHTVLQTFQAIAAVLSIIIIIDRLR